MPRPRCLIFNPYFAVLGGGERYAVAFGQVVAETHDVVYAGPDPIDRMRMDQLGFPPTNIVALDEHEFLRASVDYDLAVVVALAVPPRSFARRSVLVVQFPLGTGPSGNVVRRFMTRTKLRRYHPVVYSEFTREWLRRRWGIDSSVLHPPVELGGEHTAEKECLILGVGRFLGRADDQWNSKRQDALIEAYSLLPVDVRERWQLILAGGMSPSSEMDDYVDELRAKAAGLNISIETNVTAERLIELQQRARLFWHASGFERRPDEPERAEHFGISTVEAMSHGVIPLVYADGGQLEIVHEPWGRRWHTLAELVEETTALARAAHDELDAFGAAARAASASFGVDRFAEEVRAFLTGIGAHRGLRRRPVRVTARYGRRVRWGAHVAASRIYETAARTLNRMRSPSAGAPEPAASITADLATAPPPDFGIGEEWVADIERRVQTLTMTSTNRIYALCLAVDHVQRAGIPGAIVECGVWRGGSAMAAALTLLRAGETKRAVYLFDTFTGMTPPTDRDRDAGGRWAGDLLEGDDFAPTLVRAEATLDEVRTNMEGTGYPSVEYVVGDVLTTIPAQAPEQIALLRLDTDWYESTRHELEHLIPRVSPGGILIIDDYGHWQGAHQAVDEYLAACDRELFLCPLDYAGRLVVLS